MVRIMTKAATNCVHAMALAITVLSIPSMAQTSDSSSSRSVVISITDRKLAVVEDGVVTAIFPVAVGAAVTPSPTGEFRIVSRVSNPAYYRPGVIIPSGKNNPVGTRWLGLSLKGYGIHGTNVPSSIGRAASHGCIRLRNRDIELLFAMLQIGDRVEIHGERDDQTARLFGPAPAAEDRAVAEARREPTADRTSQDGLARWRT
jgi:lipoprotein-anchoring transpeptidase ErfK/SrfK